MIHESELMLTDGNYIIRRHIGVPAEAVRFLDNITGGSRGAVYEHKDTEEHVRMLQGPTVYALYKDDHIHGTAVFCKSPVHIGQKEVNAAYMRYFTASDDIRGRGVAPRYTMKLMRNVFEAEKKKTIYFCCVEAGNRNSHRITERLGLTKAGNIKTTGFSRFFPKRSKRIETVTTLAHKLDVLTLLQDQYGGHSFVQFNTAFVNDNYSVIREGGEVVAGCQHHPVHWVVKQLPGFSGKLVTRVVPFVPFLNRIFNPKEFRFLAFEAIYCKEGYEDRLYELFEGLLHKEKLHSAIFWMGETCPVRQRLSRKGKLGLLQSFVKDSDAFIMAACCNMSEDEVADVHSRPMYASAFDYI